MACISSGPMPVGITIFYMREYPGFRNSFLVAMAHFMLSRPGCWKGSPFIVTSMGGARMHANDRGGGSCLERFLSSKCGALPFKNDAEAEQVKVSYPVC